MSWLPSTATLFPYTTLFRSRSPGSPVRLPSTPSAPAPSRRGPRGDGGRTPRDRPRSRSEEHTSELQSRENIVCRLLLEKKKQQQLDEETSIVDVAEHVVCHK